MRFSCGKTWEQRRKEAQKEADKLLGVWHKVFLWWPEHVEVENGKHICAWLTTIEKRHNEIYVDYENDLVFTSTESRFIQN